MKTFIEKLVRSAERAEYGQYKNIALKNSNTVALLCTGLSSLFALSCLFYGAKTYAAVNLAATFFYLTSIFLNHKGRTCVGRATVHFTTLFYVFFLTDSLGHSSNVSSFYFTATLFPIMAFEYQKKRAIAFLEVLTFIFLGANFALSDNFFFPKFIKIEMPLLKYNVIAMALVSCYYLVNKLANQFAMIYEEAEKNKTDLIKNAKMMALGEMSSGLAHEMNNSLGIVMGMVSIIKKENPQLSRLTTIEKSCLKMAHIVRSLRDFSKQGTDENLKDCSLQDVVEQSLNFTKAKIANKGINLMIDDVPDAVIVGRRFQLSEAIMNLMNNSYDAVCEHKEKWIHLQFKIVDLQLTISITDSGQGIPPELIDKIMNPFFSTKGVGKGTGLGLSTSKGIIEAHQGKLIYNQMHLNTQFLILLPIKKIEILEEADKIAA